MSWTILLRFSFPPAVLSMCSIHSSYINLLIIHWESCVLEATVFMFPVCCSGLWNSCPWHSQAELIAVCCDFHIILHIPVRKIITWNCNYLYVCLLTENMDLWTRVVFHHWNPEFPRLHWQEDSMLRLNKSFSLKLHPLFSQYSFWFSQKTNLLPVIFVGPSFCEVLYNSLSEPVGMWHPQFWHDLPAGFFCSHVFPFS